MTIEEYLNHYYKHNLGEMGEGVYIRHITTATPDISQVYNWFHLMQNGMELARIKKISRGVIDKGEAIEATLRFFYDKIPMPNYEKILEKNILWNSLKFLL